MANEENNQLGNSDCVVLKLKFPVKNLDGSTVDKLVFNPNGITIGEFEKTCKNNDSEEALKVSLISLYSKIPKAVIRSMDLRDFAPMANIVMGFFQDSSQGTEQSE